MELPPRILLVRLGAIGDVANAVTVATGLKDVHPEVQIGWAVHELAAPLVTGHPDIDRVHVWRKGSLAGMREFVAELRSASYGLAVDLQRIFKGAMAARLAAPRTLGFDRARSKEGSWLLHRERLDARARTGAKSDHMVEWYMEFLRALGVDAPQPRHVLPADPAAEELMQAWVERHGRPLVIGVGASKPPNRWPAERFVALVDELAREAGPVALIGGPADVDAFASVRAAARERDGVHDLIGETTLPQLVSLLRRARLYVGCDSGPMHLAASVGTPVVALFGPADPARTGPWGNQHQVVRARPAAPGPMTEIEVRDVLAAVGSATASSSAQPGV